jgi:hypothetical protein
MAHWAELDENNVVLRVTVGSNDEPDEGYGWLIENLGGRWVQTSYNNNFRKQYAGIGYTYDEVADVFVAPQPYPSWVLDENHDWQAPVPMPSDGDWYWDEDSLAWIEVEAPGVE